MIKQTYQNRKMALICGGFSNHLDKLFNDPELSDVAIVLDNDVEGDSSAETKKFHGHRVILATMSDYFRSMLFGSFMEATQKEIRLPGVPYSSFVKIMEFVYLGRTTPSAGTLEEAVNFYSLVRMLLMDSNMKLYFGRWMIKHLELSQAWKKDLLKIFALAFEWDISSLVQKCNSLFSDIANEYLANSSFVELPLGAVQMILKASGICCTRAELKKAIQGWISHHKQEIASDVADELNTKLAKFGENCYDFSVLSLRQKKAQPKLKDVQTLAERAEPVEAMHEYSYRSALNLLECLCLRGIKICLRANPKFGPQHRRIKSELELCLKIDWDYNNHYQRTITIRYDFTKHEQQAVTIFFPEIASCKESLVNFYLSWKGSGVQPLLLDYGPSKSNRKIKTSSTYVTHILYQDKDEYESDGRCPECTIPDYSDRYSSSSYYYESDEEMVSPLETESSENDIDEN